MANDAAVKALLAQEESLASMVDGDGAIAEFQADERLRENLAVLERMAPDLRHEERARRTGGDVPGAVVGPLRRAAERA